METPTKERIEEIRAKHRGALHHIGLLNYVEVELLTRIGDLLSALDAAEARAKECELNDRRFRAISKYESDAHFAYRDGGIEFNQIRDPARSDYCKRYLFVTIAEAADWLIAHQEPKA